MASGLILRSPKTPANLMFSGVCRDYEMVTLARNGSTYSEALQSDVKRIHLCAGLSPNFASTINPLTLSCIML